MPRRILRLSSPPAYVGFSLFLLSSVILLFACGVPGPPVPPTPKIPTPPRDLVAEQQGERIRLRWSLSLLNTDGTRIRHGQRAGVFRWFTDSLDGIAERFAAEAGSAYVIPEDVLERFVRDGQVEFTDPLGPRRLADQAGRYAVYGVKVMNRKDEAAGFSNLAAVHIFPVPRLIAAIETRVTEETIELNWAAPSRTTSGTPIPVIAGYRIYRRRDPAQGFALIATAPTPHYADRDFQFGQTYEYRVRTLARFDSDTIESEDSAVASVTPRDVFPPPAPSNLVAIATPGRVDLTWDATLAADLAGFFVYRSYDSGGDHQRLTPTPVPVPSFSDTEVAANTTYYYVVSAVDRAGNESPFSEPAATPPPPR